MLTVLLDGQAHTHIKHPAELTLQADLANVNVSRLSIPADELAAFEANQQREKIRREIEPVAGDTQSIQGTIADAVGLLLEELGRFMQAAQNSSDPVIANAAQPLSNALAPLVAAVDAGDCVLTHHVKTIPVVISDACERGNAAAGVFIANASEAQP